MYIYNGGYNISYIYGRYMYMDISWLVGGIPTPMKNISSSVGIMTFPIEKNKIHVPNHQPDGNILGYGDINHQQWGLHMYINVLCGCLQGI